MSGTMAQKILERASGKKNVKPGEFVIANIDIAMMQDVGTDEVTPILERTGVKKFWDPDRIVITMDHYVPAPGLDIAEMHKGMKATVKKYGIKNFYKEGVGVCHQVMVDKGYVVPGELIVATDSHTTTYGALGAAGTGIGRSEMSYVLTTGKLWFQVPETIKFNMKGKLQERITSKDIMLYIAGKYSSSVAEYKAVEYSGPVARQMSVESRMTMSNMSIEIGAKFGFFAPDAKTVAFLKSRTERPYTMIKPDADAVYEHVYDVDVTDLEPQIAIPYTVDNVKPISKIGNIKVDQAVLGSCTNGRIEDLRMAAEILKGKKVHPDVRLLVLPASMRVYQEALEDDTLKILTDAGAVLCPAGCGPCFGAHLGVLASGQVCVASINRNFKGRMGSPDSRVFLASPATVAASAIAGKIVDPRGY